MSWHNDMYPFRKYVEVYTKCLWNEETIKIKGTFKEPETGKIVDGDILQKDENTFRGVI